MRNLPQAPSKNALELGLEPGLRPELQRETALPGPVPGGATPVGPASPAQGPRPPLLDVPSSDRASTPVSRLLPVSAWSRGAPRGGGQSQKTLARLPC